MRHKGFTAVELLVTIIVGALIVGSAYQIYATIVRDTNDSILQSRASSVAYEIIREQQMSLPAICKSSDTGAVTITASNHPSSFNIIQQSKIPNASGTILIDCPYADPNDDRTISKITVTINYGAPAKGVTRAIALRR